MSTVEPTRIEETPAGNRNAKETFVRAAFEIVADRTIAGTRTRDIAERAGYKLGHLTYYFPSKRSVLLAVLDHMERTFLEERRESLADVSKTSIERLAIFFEQERRLIIHRPDLLTARADFWVQGRSDTVIRERIRLMYASFRSDIERVVADGVSNGTFSADRAPMVPDLVMSLLEGAELQYLTEPNRLDLDRYFAAALDIVSNWLSVTAPPSAN
jgi:AcrR family transcriptional regulator